MRNAESKPAAGSDRFSGATASTGFLLQRAHRRLRAALNEALRPVDLMIAHVAVLALLAERGDMIQQQLIEILDADKSTMVYLIDELERQGLALRRRAPADRRAYEVHLTRAGRDRLVAAGKIVERVQNDFLAPLSAPDRDRLNKLLSRVAGPQNPS